jgi:hypothetical protein
MYDKTEAIVTGFHRALAHAFSREITAEQVRKLHTLKERYEKRMLALSTHSRQRWAAYGRKVFQREKEKLM